MKAVITIMILFAVSFFYYAVRMCLVKGKNAKSGVSEAPKTDDGKKQDKDKMEDGR